MTLEELDSLYGPIKQQPDGSVWCYNGLRRGPMYDAHSYECLVYAVAVPDGGSFRWKHHWDAAKDGQAVAG